MDLYTLDSVFNPYITLDEYISAIWTERYSTHGDTQLVVPATGVNKDVLKEGTMLGLHGSDEVMILETQSVENGLLTVTGKDLLSFLEQRMAWFANLASDDESNRITDYVVDTMVPGAFISHVVSSMVIDPPLWSGVLADVNLDWDNEVIPNLELGDIDTSGDVKRLTAAIGPLYTSIAQIAGQENVGISLYLESADPDTGYVLKFKTYRGLDRTSAQDINELVRLSPQLETMHSIKEINSIAEFKNVVYVMYKGEVSEHLLDEVAGDPTGFQRRVLLTNAEGEPPGRKPSLIHPSMPGTVYPSIVGSTEVTDFREQNARDALANHNYIQAMDGEVSPTGEKFGEDYGLGDVIELQSPSGFIQQARVTEHIRSSDKLGKREYPTISVIS